MNERGCDCDEPGCIDYDMGLREAEEEFAELMFAADPSIRPRGWKPKDRADNKTLCQAEGTNRDETGVR